MSWEIVVASVWFFLDTARAAFYGNHVSLNLIGKNQTIHLGLLRNKKSKANDRLNDHLLLILLYTTFYYRQSIIFDKLSYNFLSQHYETLNSTLLRLCFALYYPYFYVVMQIWGVGTWFVRNVPLFGYKNPFVFVQCYKSLIDVVFSINSDLFI